MNHEVEIKLRLPSARQGRMLLEQAGFAVSAKRHLERNFVVDTAKSSLRHTGRLLRLRNTRDKVVLTFKGKSLPGKHKSREEIELCVPDFDQMLLLLERIGFQPIFRYEKYRTEYTRKGERGHALLDETPIGAFLELEGRPAWIDRAAKRLGFEERDYIKASYGSLYAAYCKKQGIPAADFVFERKKKEVSPRTVRVAPASNPEA
jgi:adenylate cyclase class 2